MSWRGRLLSNPPKASLGPLFLLLDAFAELLTVFPSLFFPTYLGPFLHFWQTFSWDGVALTGKTEGQTAALLLCNETGASLRQLYESRNQPSQLTSHVSHIFSLYFTHKDLRISIMGWKEESFAWTRLAGLPRLENKVCVLSVGNRASGQGELSHKHTNGCQGITTVQHTFPGRVHTHTLKGS